jgi:hypothetical protein
MDELLVIIALGISGILFFGHVSNVLEYLSEQNWLFILLSCLIVISSCVSYVYLLKIYLSFYKKGNDNG